MVTNLTQIKVTTKALARAISPVALDGIPFLDSHPFLDSVIWYDKMLKCGVNNLNVTNSDSLEFSDFSFTNPKVYDEWLTDFDRIVDKAENITRLYMLYRDPYKLTFMKFNADFMSKKDFAQYLSDAWVTEDNPNMDVNVPPKESIKLFKKADKKFLMEKDDFEYYQNLPDKIEVFRGVSVGRTKYGLSWTDDKEKAEWFKNRFSNFSGNKNKGLMLRAIVEKNDVLAYLNTRGEKELVVDVFKIKNKIEVI